MDGGVPIYSEFLVIIEVKNCGRFPRADSKQVQFPAAPGILRNDSRTVGRTYGVVRVLDDNAGTERVPIPVNPSCDAEGGASATEMEKVNRLSGVQFTRYQIEPTFGDPSKTTGGQYVLDSCPLRTFLLRAIDTKHSSQS
jgi:hypothetical protein